MNRQGRRGPLGNHGRVTAAPRRRALCHRGGGRGRRGNPHRRLPITAVSRLPPRCPLGWERRRSSSSLLEVGESGGRVGGACADRDRFTVVEAEDGVPGLGVVRVSLSRMRPVPRSMYCSPDTHAMAEDRLRAADMDLVRQVLRFAIALTSSRDPDVADGDWRGSAAMACVCLVRAAGVRGFWVAVARLDIGTARVVLTAALRGSLLGRPTIVGG